MRYLIAKSLEGNATHLLVDSLRAWLQKKRFEVDIVLKGDKPSWQNFPRLENVKFLIWPWALVCFPRDCHCPARELQNAKKRFDLNSLIWIWFSWALYKAVMCVTEIPRGKVSILPNWVVLKDLLVFDNSKRNFDWTCLLVLRIR